MAKVHLTLCGIPLTDDLGVYLGVPIVHKRASKELYAGLIDKVRHKLSNCKRNVLSRAGRRTLVQSVINAIPVYTMQTAMLPSSICDQLDRLARNSLWGGSEAYSNNHLVHWESISLPYFSKKPGSSYTWRGILQCRKLLERAMVTHLDEEVATWNLDSLITSERQWDLTPIQHLLPPDKLNEILEITIPIRLEEIKR